MHEVSPPEEIVERFRQIGALILRLPHKCGPEIVRLDSEIKKLEELYRRNLQSFEERARKVQQIEEEFRKLYEPPTQHALVIGPSPRQPGAYVISVGGQRYDVWVAPSQETRIDPEQLVEGQEVLILEKSHAIVGVVGPMQRGESAEVLDVLDNPDTGLADRLLVRRGSSESIVVEMSARLRRQPATGAVERGESALKPGDTVLIDSGARMAFEKLPTHETSGLELTEDPDQRYEDVAGLDDKIERIKEAIELPYLYRDEFTNYKLERPRGILLYGPPGCGKTMIGKAVANGLRDRIKQQLDGLIRKLELYLVLDERDPDERESAELREVCPAAAAALPARAAALERLKTSLREGTPPEVVIDLQQPRQTLERLKLARQNVKGHFLNIKGPELLSKWVGEAELRVRQIFTQARSKASYTTPVVLFFDEIEAMFQRRGMGISTDLEKTMVPQLLTELDGVETLRNVILIGASNRHELLDPALMRPGRLDIKIKIDRPDRAAAVSIFRRYLTPSLPLSDEGLTEGMWERFDREVSRAVSRLADAGSYLTVTAGGAAPALLPLRSVLTEELLPEVSRALRKHLSAHRNGQPDKSRLSSVDLGRAIEEACRAHLPELDGARRVLAGGAQAQVVLSLEAAAETLDEEQLSGLLLWDAGAGDARDGRAVPQAKLSGEQLSLLIIESAVNTLFSPSSYLRARTLAQCGREYIFLLREYVSGALINNIVARAKRFALKRGTEVGGRGARGISLRDVLTGIRAEYRENREQFITNKPEISEATCEVCKRRHASADEFDIEVVLGRASTDRWHVPRRPPYERGRGGAAAAVRRA